MFAVVGGMPDEDGFLAPRFVMEVLSNVFRELGL